jgi:hypothetical protein
VDLVKRIVRVSIETMKIVEGLPGLNEKIWWKNILILFLLFIVMMLAIALGVTATSLPVTAPQPPP